MKSKVRLNRSDNTTVVEYFRVKKPFEFRYNLLSELLKEYGEAIMFINTNSKTKEPDMRVEAYFDENNIEYAMFKIDKNERKLFGISFGKGKKKAKLSEKFIMGKVNADIFTEDFFNSYVSTYDIALGFGSKLTIDEMHKDYRENSVDLFFDKEYFSEFIYDSIIFTCCRSTVDTKELAAESEKRTK